ncbi:MAG TPA: radical SAM protein, partial [Ilumatobacteraceae bacterium]
MSVESLVSQLKGGLDAPICLTWELTYACNLQCVHCLSSSGQRDPRELTTDEAKRVLDELHDLQVFYINIGGGEPMIRRDFFELVEYAISRGIGVKFSTNGAFIDADKARRLAAMDYLDVQI